MPPTIEEVKAQVNQAFISSIRFLSIRARSEKEIDTYLFKKKFDPQIILSVIEKLKEKKYINDTEFAKSWIEMRQNNKGKSKFVIKQELLEKGVDREIIDKLLTESAKSDLEAATNLIKKKVLRFQKYQGLEYEKKVGDFLQRKGFSWEIVKQVLKDH